VGKIMMGGEVHWGETGIGKTMEALMINIINQDATGTSRPSLYRSSVSVNLNLNLNFC